MAEAADIGAECDPCKTGNCDKKAITFCIQCREFYCASCSSKHKAFKVTKSHRQVHLEQQEGTLIDSTLCDHCNNEQEATSVCLQCKELYCIDCCFYHSNIKATRNHKTVRLPNNEKDDISLRYEKLNISKKSGYAAAQVPVYEVHATLPSPHPPTPPPPRYQEEFRSTTPPLPRYQGNVRSATSSLPRYQENFRSATPPPPRYQENFRPPTPPLPRYEEDVRPYTPSSCPSTPPPDPPYEEDADTGTTATATYESSFSTDTGRNAHEIQRMVTLRDDRIVVLDSVNNILQVFTEDDQYLLRIEDHPNGLTVVDEHSVAVSHVGHRQSQIILYTLSTNSNKNYTFRIKCGRDGGHLFDISSVGCVNGGGGLHFVCLRHDINTKKRRIETIDSSGKIKKIVKEKGQFMFSDHIVGDGNCFYVSSGNPNQVRCFSLTGREMWNIPLRSMPYGMTLVRGFLWFTLYAQGMVCQVASDSSYEDVVVKIEGLTKPHSIAFQERRNKLLVSGFKRKQLIHVYSLH